MNDEPNADRQFETRVTTPDRADDGTGDTKLEVNVIFTTEDGTLAALRTACDLAADLDARINLIAMQEVPWALPLTRPSVPIQWTEQRLFNVVCQGAQGPLEIHAHVFLCRDKRHALLKALRPKSLVVIGGRIVWWGSEAKRIARMLERHGHRVILAVQK